VELTERSGLRGISGTGSDEGGGGCGVGYVSFPEGSDVLCF
jgi:hypothetical protein